MNESVLHAGAMTQRRAQQTHYTLQRITVSIMKDLICFLNVRIIIKNTAYRNAFVSNQHVFLAFSILPRLICVTIFIINRRQPRQE